MDAKRSRRTPNDKRGLSFAFPMRLPDGGTGAGVGRSSVATTKPRTNPRRTAAGSARRRG
ncbi:MAG TPA: hypothetical protein ENJ00_00615 [Phycisphaerales bacterium]|nr:hypothetical protein [Phycisphaerales bacterium]